MLGLIVLLILLVLLCFLVYRVYIGFGRVGQYIRSDAPVHHKSKEGTPTAGGTIFWLFILIFSIIVNWIYTIPLYEAFLILFIGGFVIGFYDDLMKILNKRNLGLRARDKLFLQFLLTIIIFFILKINDLYFVNNFSVNFSSLFFHTNRVDLGWGYLIFLYFFISAVSNATNLTDGLDGLLASLSLTGFIAYLIIFLIMSNLPLVYLILGIISFISVFLFFNLPKAKVFMGDSGSMTIGSIFVYLSIISKTEIYFLFIGYIYFLVTLSVILQVLYFKITKGRRLFNFTPLHHHFELMGYRDKEILLKFNFLNLVFVIIGLFFILLKLI